MKSRNIAFLLAFLAALIYGLSFTVAKEVMPVYIRPFGFILLRVLGATILFWTVGIFLKKEKIETQDYPRLLLGAVFGIALNQLSFFKGLSMTTPINASVIMVTATPCLLNTISTSRNGAVCCRAYRAVNFDHTASSAPWRLSRARIEALQTQHVAVTRSVTHYEMKSCS